MILQVLVVYDSKARAYLLPMFTTHVDVCLRAFADAANDPAHQVGKHPEDFTLFHLGVWNDDDAVFVWFKEHVNLGLAAQFKKGVRDV